MAGLCQRPLATRLTDPQPHGRMCILQVPAGHIWIQGDNLPASLDSRQYGPVPLALVRGRVVAQLYPRLRTAQGLAQPSL